MLRDLTWLVGATIVLWIVAGIPAAVLAGPGMLLFAGVAAVLCLLPGAATLCWSRWASSASPEHQLAAMLGGTVLRMVVVVAGGMVVFYAVAGFQRISFWLWVVGFYLATLCVEVVLLARRGSRTAPAKTPVG